MKILRPSPVAVIALLLALAALDAVSAVGAPLDAAACAELQTKLDTLRSEGAAADMARGPEWAQANLPLGRLQRIQELLETEEQLNFRCGLAKARISLPTTLEGGEEEIPAPGEATVEGAQRTIMLPQKAPAAQKRPAPAASAAAAVPAIKPATRQQPVKAAPRRKAPETAAQPAAEGAPPKKKKAPAKKKPQADDAYRPPPRPLASDGGWTPAVRQ